MRARGPSSTARASRATRRAAGRPRSRARRRPSCRRRSPAPPGRRRRRGRGRARRRSRCPCRFPLRPWPTPHPAGRVREERESVPGRDEGEGGEPDPSRAEAVARAPGRQLGCKVGGYSAVVSSPIAASEYAVGLASRSAAAPTLEMFQVVAAPSAIPATTVLRPLTRAAPRPAQALRSCRRDPVPAPPRRRIVQRATTLELFYDLVFVFAITQVSHLLLDHLTLARRRAVALVLLVVWWAWNYTTWVTNELDPDSLVVRLLLIGIMLPTLLMASRSPTLSATRAALRRLVRRDPGRAACVSDFVSAGAARSSASVRAASSSGSSPRACSGSRAGLVDGEARSRLWLVALAIDYAAPSVVYWVPGLRRLDDAAWEVETAHFAERFQLFMIIALGESIVLTGATTAGSTSTRRASTALRARVPRHGGALVALLRLRRPHRRASARAFADRRGWRATATRTSTSSWSRA